MVSRKVLAACRRGDPRAFEEVVRATHRQVYTQALRIVGDRQEAEDVAQEAYLRVYRGLSGFREEARFETWLYRIVANTAMSYLRRKGRFGSLMTDPDEALEPTQQGVPLEEIAADQDQISRALESLPASLKTVVVLKDVYGFSCLEIGKEIGVSEGAVKVRLHRARKRLRDQLFAAEAAS